MREKISIFLFLLFAFEVVSQMLTPTGFCYPTGRPPSSRDNFWLECDNRYYIGYCHLGHDFVGDVGDTIRAIADGEIFLISSADWGVGNIGLLVMHYLDNGDVFLAIYGHLKYQRYEIGSKVVAGELIGIMGRYHRGDHLHFGIFRNRYFPKNGWGRMRSPARYPYHGLTNPIRWIEDKFPRNESDRNCFLLFIGSGISRDGDVLLRYNKINVGDSVSGIIPITFLLDSSTFYLKNMSMGIRRVEDLPNVIVNKERGNLFNVVNDAGYRTELVQINLTDWNFLRSRFLFGSIHQINYFEKVTEKELSIFELKLIKGAYDGGF